MSLCELIFICEYCSLLSAQQKGAMMELLVQNTGHYNIFHCYVSLLH